MITLEVKVKGIKEFQRAMERFPRLMDKHMNPAMDRAAKSLEREGKDQAPRDTGNLADRIYATRATKLRVRVIDQTDYGIYPHEGTIYQRPNPFLRRALRRQRPVIVRYMADGMRKALWEAGRRSR